MTIMKRFDLLKFYLFFMLSFISISILGLDDPSDIYFASQNRALLPQLATDDEIKEHFRKVYQEEEISINGLEADNYDFSVLKGKKLKCFAAIIGNGSNFEVDMLKDMPLEVLNLFFNTPRKLSELQPLLTPSLKELYLYRVIVDEPSLLSSLKLETLVLDGITYNDDVMTIIAQMKSLKRLGLRFYYRYKSNGSWDWSQRWDIPFAMLNDLSLRALDLEYVSPAVLYFLEKQKQLKILRVNAGPNLNEHHLVPVIAGREFDLLAINNLMHNNKRRVLKPLEEYRVQAEILFINREQVIPENDNQEKRAE